MDCCFGTENKNPVQKKIYRNFIVYFPANPHFFPLLKTIFSETDDICNYATVSYNQRSHRHGLLLHFGKNKHPCSRVKDHRNWGGVAPRRRWPTSFYRITPQTNISSPTHGMDIFASQTINKTGTIGLWCFLMLCVAIITVARVVPDLSLAMWKVVVCQKLEECGIRIFL